jgi:ABC-type transport system involved in multi-copper enzyme maturation permease subunit
MKLVGAELAKLRHMVVFRAVAWSLLLGPAAVILILRLVASDISAAVGSPGDIVLGSVVLLAAFGGTVLTASLLGGEFDQGTARMLLSRGISRLSLLSVKMVVAVVAVTAAGELASLAGTGEAMLAGWQPTARQGAEVLGRTLWLVPLASLAYVGFTALGAIVGRSTAAGMLAGLLLFMGDFMLATLRTPIPFGEWLPVANLLALLGGTFSFVLPPGSAPTAGVAAARLAIFGVLTILAGTLLFQRQDVHR